MKSLETEKARLRKAIADLTRDTLILQEASRGRRLAPRAPTACAEHIQLTMTVSERRACRALGQHRSTQRRVPRGRDDEAALTADLVALAETYASLAAAEDGRFDLGAGHEGQDAADEH